MPTHLTKIGDVLFPPHRPRALRPFFLTRSGQPRVAFMESLKTKERLKGEEAARLRGVEVDRLFREAEARLAAMRADPAAQAEWEEFVAREEAAQLMFREDDAMCAGKPQRRAIIDRLNKPRAEMTPAELAFPALIPNEEFAPEEERQRRTATIAADWKEGEALAGEWFAAMLEGKERPSPRLCPRGRRLSRS